MTRTSDPDEGWSPPPDEGQAGMVLLPNGWWGYRYMAGVRPVIVEKPEERDATPGGPPGSIRIADGPSTALEIDACDASAITKFRGRP